MKFHRMGIYLITLLLAVACIGFLLQENPQTGPPFSFSAKTKAGTETIYFWNRGDGSSYVFLPGYLELSSLHLLAKDSIWLDGEELSPGADCGHLKPQTTYPLTGVEGLHSLTFLPSENLPAMYIDTASGSMEYIHQKKENKESGRLRLYDSTGELNYSGNFESIKMRGNNYTLTEKKPYNLTLLNDIDLLGMGEAKNWALQSDSFDPTHLRNRIVMDTARNLGLPYTPETQWIDLFLNGEYVGLYQLSEKNEVHPQRVDLKGDGFLVSQELWARAETQQDPIIYTMLGAALRVRHNTIGQSSLEEAWWNLDNAISGEGSVHWSELLDQESWIKKYLIEEVFGNLDGGAVSQFFYMDRSNPGGKVFAGPVWDYDMAMANPCVYQEHGGLLYDTLVPNIFYANRSPDDFGSPWYYQLYQDPLFYQPMVETYQKELLPLIQNLLDFGIQQYTEMMIPAAKLDQLRWNTSDVEAEIQKLSTYLSQRVGFLNKIWLENQDYVTVRADFHWRYTTYVVFPGESLPELPMAEGCSWFLEGEETPLDLGQPIYEYLRIENREDPSLQIQPQFESHFQTVSRRNWALWIPVLSITAVFLLLFFTDILRMIRRYRSHHDPTTQIPPRAKV